MESLDERKGEQGTVVDVPVIHREVVLSPDLDDRLDGGARPER